VLQMKKNKNKSHPQTGDYMPDSWALFFISEVQNGNKQI
jgi:hypothetical protein